MAESIEADLRRRAADEGGIAEAARLLGGGRLAALPTETVYGLAADAADAAAVAAIFEAKGRPAHNPLIVHVADLAMAARYGRITPLAARLAAAFWPGPLTLVVPRVADAPLAPAVTAGLPTVALRVPAHPVMQGVIRALGRGLAAPSANRSGRLTPTRPGDVTLAGAALVLDAGPAAHGLESSIVDATGATPILLRPGAIAAETLAVAAGTALSAGAHGSVRAPGMLLRHYAPRLPLRLDALQAAGHEYHLGFGPVAGDASLSPSGDLAEAAARLFALLHDAERSGRQAIAVAPIPVHGLGAAINDRLRRAAASQRG